MANDPRFTNVLPIDQYPEADDADVLTARLFLSTGAQGIGTKREIKDILNMIRVANSQPPTDSDLIADVSQSYRDTQNLNTYLSIEGGDWEYESTKGVRERVYLGTYANTTGTISTGEYQATATGIGLGIVADTARYRNIADLLAKDEVYVGSKLLRVTSTGFASGQWTIFGDWDEAFADLTFDASESIYYSRKTLFLFETLWSGYVNTNTPTTTIQTLNPGKRFSDYEFLSFTYGGNEAPRQLTLPQAEFGSTLEVGNSARYLKIVKATDTSWNRVSGGSGSDLRKIVGIKAVA